MRISDAREVGQTGLRVTALGLGTATLGGGRGIVTSSESQNLIDAAWDAGVRYYDTAPLYGVGAAERRVGDALRHLPRDAWVLSTKVGRLLTPTGNFGPLANGRLAPLPFAPRFDYSYDAIMRSIEDSYQRLGLANIDILYVHDIGVYQHGENDAPKHLRVLRESGYRALDELKRGGVVRAVGIGVNETSVLIDEIENYNWDVFLLAGRYTLLEQTPLDTLFPLCLSRQVSIVIGGPLNSGILAGGDTWDYSKAPPEVLQKVRKITAICAKYETPLAAAALQFPLAHPAVSSMIPGPRSVQEFATNREWLTHDIPEALWAELKECGLLRAEAPVPTQTGLTG